MRHVLVVFLFVLTAAASAQQPAASRPLPAPPPPVPPQPVRPQTTAPPTVAPPMVLPLPPLPQQPAGGLTTPVPFTPQNPTIAPRDLYRVRPGVPYRTRSRIPYGGYGYVGGGYIAGDYGAAENSVTPQGAAGPSDAQQPAGMLRLDMSPASAQVFVDSFFVGTVADIEARRVLSLPAGPHRIEVRAQDYQPTTFDVRIDPGDTITYRGALQPVRAAVPARPAAGAPSATKLYVIPNCYLGNVPPRADHLPKGCDVKQVHVVGGN